MAPADASTGSWQRHGSGSFMAPADASTDSSQQRGSGSVMAPADASTGSWQRHGSSDSDVGSGSETHVSSGSGVMPSTLWLRLMPQLAHGSDMAPAQRGSGSAR